MAKSGNGWKKVARNDGVEAHNLEYQIDGDHLVLRTNIKGPTILSKNQKPMVATTRGFARVEGLGVGLNIMAAKS